MILAPHRLGRFNTPEECVASFVVPDFFLQFHLRLLGLLNKAWMRIVQRVSCVGANNVESENEGSLEGSTGSKDRQEI